MPLSAALNGLFLSTNRPTVIQRTWSNGRGAGCQLAGPGSILSGGGSGKCSELLLKGKRMACLYVRSSLILHQTVYYTLVTPMHSVKAACRVYKNRQGEHVIKGRNTLSCPGWLAR